VLPDLRCRATEPEQLDEGVSDSEARRSLADIRFVNRWLGGRRALRRTILPHLTSGARVLDVGCGSGDLTSWAARSGPPPILAVGVDIKLLHLQEAPAEIQPVVADVRALPFRPRSFDVVTASLFLHHFDGAEVATVLRSLYGLARRALIVNDLRRAQVPYVFGRLLFPVVFRSRVSVHDGLLSIRRAFTPAELGAAFREAGIPGARVDRRFPYRLVAFAPANA
jgi:2-polyprenyl-3-methyl-5-hydroxy-6-metoxy-1,4-benzoquinol methylase